MHKRKIRIGILTFHRSINYGAFMQCYSLSKRIQKDFPETKVEVIDYVCKTVYERYTPTIFSYIAGPKLMRNSFKEAIKRLGKVVLFPQQMYSQKIRYKAFQSALCYLPLSSTKVISDDMREFYKNYKDVYDIIVVGSDAVWEFLNYPFPNVYFMHNKISKYCLSYAASCDRMHITNVNDNQVKYINEAIKNFDYLGVRDVSTESFLGAIRPGLVTYHNSDPTALLEMDMLFENRKKTKEKLIAHGIDITKPMIGVMGGRIMCKFVKEEFGRTHQIISLYNFNPEADYNIIDLSPLEWATVFSFFDITFTRYFHGFWLSVVNGVPPIVLDDWFMIDENHASKLLDLSRRLELTDCYFKMTELKERKQDIIKKAQELLSISDRENLLKRVKKEAESYSSFKEALGVFIDNL